MLASAVAQKEGCLRDTVLKIWNRHAKATGTPHLPQPVRYSVFTGQVLRTFKPPEPMAPEPLIDHGLRLQELGDHQCSWPLHGRDEDGRLRFCGASRPESPDKLSPFYCETHVALARGVVVDVLVERPIENNAELHADDILLDELAEAA